MRRLLIALVALLPLAGQAGPSVGQVFKTGGDVEVFRSGRTLSSSAGDIEVFRNGQLAPAAPGSAVEVGDVFVTGPGQAAALRMSDDQTISLGASSRFQVVSYQFDSQDRAGNHARYRLESGSARMISGLISKQRSGSVVLETAYGEVTTVGTDYIVGICDVACESPGFYISVNAGSVTVSGDGVSQTASMGQIIFIAAAGGSPVLVASLPSGFLPAPDPAVIILSAIIPGSTLRLDVAGPICDGEASPTTPECTASR